MKAAMRDAGIRWIACFAHCINTCVKASFKDIESPEFEVELGFGALKKKVKGTVTLFKQSVLAKREFEHCQRRAWTPEPNARKKFSPSAMKQDVETRWNACYLMLDSFIDHRDALSLYQNTESGREHNIS